jgi:hypothetical protein
LQQYPKKTVKAFLAWFGSSRFILPKTELIIPETIKPAAKSHII